MFLDPGYDWDPDIFKKYSLFAIVISTDSQE